MQLTILGFDIIPTNLDPVIFLVKYSQDTSSWTAAERGVEILLLEASHISKLFRCILPILLTVMLLTTLSPNLKQKESFIKQFRYFTYFT